VKIVKEGLSDYNRYSKDIVRFVNSLIDIIQKKHFGQIEDGTLRNAFEEKILNSDLVDIANKLRDNGDADFHIAEVIYRLLEEEEEFQGMNEEVFDDVAKYKVKDTRTGKIIDDNMPKKLAEKLAAKKKEWAVSLDSKNAGLTRENFEATGGEGEARKENRRVSDKDATITIIEKYKKDILEGAKINYREFTPTYNAEISKASLLSLIITDIKNLK